MSLEQAAKHLAAHGRGPDTHLVHMSSGEIKSLQQLAKANGGSLTINPHTGLPEAGFLSNILPVVAGAAAMYFTGGTAAPLIAGLSNSATIGLGIGALQTARTGSLQKGLMAGLGAYGGAGLAGGLMGAGATAAGNAAANSAYSAGAGATDATAQAAGYGSAEEMAQVQAAQANAAKTASMSNWDKLGSGVSSLGQSGGLSNLSNTMAASGGPSLGRAAFAAAAPALLGAMQPTTPQPQIQAGDSKMPQRLQYNVGRPVDAQGQTVTPPPDVPGYGDLGRDFGREQNYFPYAGYQNITDEQAKQMRGYAYGGTIEEMSNANAVGANTGYPQADIKQVTYATPYQTPAPQNVVAGAQDVAVDPYTGQEQRTVPAPTARFAGGGNIELRGRIDMGDGQGGGQSGGFGSAGANGYQAAGSGSPGQFNQTNVSQPPQQGMSGLGAMTPQMLQQFGQRMFGGGYGGAEPQGMSQTQLQGLGRSIAANQQGPVGGFTSAANQPDANADAVFRDLLAFTGERGKTMATGGMAHGGVSHLGDYSDGGRLLKGPGDGVSDSIPATIGNKRPARLADGEFVVPARIVSELGNGSTDAGARKLYAMLDRVQSARKKSIGKGKVAKNSRADKFLPA